MTVPQSPQNLPAAAALNEELAEAREPEPAGPPIGAADAEADAAASGADQDVAAGRHDSDGVPVGEDDLEADKRNSGA